MVWVLLYHKMSSDFEDFTRKSPILYQNQNCYCISLCCNSFAVYFRSEVSHSVDIYMVYLSLTQSQMLKYLGIIKCTNVVTICKMSIANNIYIGETYYGTRSHVLGTEYSSNSVYSSKVISKLVLQSTDLVIYQAYLSQANDNKLLTLSKN